MIAYKYPLVSDAFRKYLNIQEWELENNWNLRATFNSAVLCIVDNDSTFYEAAKRYGLRMSS